MIDANKVQINIFSASDQHARSEVERQVNSFLGKQPDDIKFLDAKLQEDLDSATVMVITYEQH